MSGNHGKIVHFEDNPVLDRYLQAEEMFTVSITDSQVIRNQLVRPFENLRLWVLFQETVRNENFNLKFVLLSQSHDQTVRFQVMLQDLLSWWLDLET